MMDSEEERAIQSFITRVKVRFRIKKIYLYGSSKPQKYADIQLLVLTEGTVTKENSQPISHIASEINEEFGVSLASQCMNIIGSRH